MKTRVLVAASALSVFAMGAYAATTQSAVITIASTQATQQAATASPAIVLPVAPVATAPIVRATTTATAKPAPLAKLPPLNLSSMRLWNYAAIWHASEWASAFSSTPWKFNHVVKAANGDVRFILDAKGAPELKAGPAIGSKKDGLWEAEVTLPVMRDGLVVAPLWLYSGATRDEIDFEYAGRKGLDVTVHKYVNGLHLQKTQRLFAGVDMSGQRKRFGIEVSKSSGTIKMYLNGALVHTFDKKTMGFFPESDFRPIISVWPARSDWSNFVQWVGKWTPLKANEQTVMVVHGYGYTAR